MTPQQNACLIAIRTLTVDGVAPTVRELMAHLGVRSSSRVQEMIEALEEQGFIRRRPGRYRCIEIVERYGSGLSDARIASMSDEALESAHARIGAALTHRRALSQSMGEMAA
jgi:SOS-response transcriptional repressor LexA